MGDVHCPCNSLYTQVSAVIFDLDGTLLDTEQVFKSVFKEFLQKYGKVPSKEKEDKRQGMTQKENAIAIVNDYDLPLSPDEFTQQILPVYRKKLLLAKALSGADRLLRHLHQHGVPFSLASNSVSRNVDTKISHQGWKKYFRVILGSDQVKSGKPAPDLFLEAAKQMEVDAAHCLVIEDSVVGVKAAKAAGMKVVAVPSLHSERRKYFIADLVIHSLQEFQPEQWGIPPFQDWVHNSVPVEPICLKGLYHDGILHECPGGPCELPDQIFGIYFGHARFEKDQILKAVVSIGWESSCFMSKRRILVHIVDGSAEQLQDHEMQLVLVGYIKTSCRMQDVADNLEILNEDMSIAKAALELPEFANDMKNLCGVFAARDDAFSFHENA